MATEVLNLGGRYFAPAESTSFAQDEYLMGVVTQGNLHVAVEEPDPARLVSAVLGSGCTTRLLAGLLVEVDTEWSPEGAREAEAYFAQLRDPEAKAQLRGAVGWLLTGFFGGAGSSSSSTTNDSATSPDAAPPAAAKRVRPKRRRPGSTANGQTSS